MAYANEMDEVRGMVMDDHRDLLSALRGVEALVESASCATGDVARRLAALAQLLAEHIAEEERSALFRDYPSRYPQVRDELLRLQAAHAPMLTELRELSVASESANRLELDSPMSIRIRTAIAALRQHEAAEADVLARLRR
jgi:hypothetical protein